MTISQMTTSYRVGETVTVVVRMPVRSAIAERKVGIPRKSYAAQKALPVQQFYLASVPENPGWVISQPLPLTIEQDTDGSIVVSDPFFAVYGVGDTEGDAIRDFAVSMIEYYDILHDHAGTGNKHTDALF